MIYGDILWVEDFDDGDSSPLEEKIKNYYGESRIFRVDVQQRVWELLQKLEDEKIFSKYSCAVLDINLNRGFKMIKREFKPTKNLLEKHKIRILDEHEPQNTKTYADFAENAGYYVYLYLIRRGMPAERICMLTGNKGNTTDAWEKNFAEKDLFKNAGLIAPEAFDRETERENFHAWLDEKLTPSYRLRSCIVGMSRCAENFSDDKTKAVLKNLPQIPSRFSDDEKVANKVFVSALQEIVRPWESLKTFAEFGSLKYAYQVTLTTTRNWLAHNVLTKELSLLATAFLFGIGLRGLLGGKIDSAEYRRWEDELLALLSDLDKKILQHDEKNLGELVMKSCREFFKRVTAPDKTLKIPLTNDLSKIIHGIGQKNYKIEPRTDTDLIRNFLHGVYPIRLVYKEGKIHKNPEYRLGIMFHLDENKFYSRQDNIEAKYLNAVKNTLARAVDS